MAGVVLATGIVELIPSMRGSQRGIANELSGIDTKSVGRSLGKNMGHGIAGSLRTIVGGAIAALGAVKVGGITKEAVSDFSELEDSTAAASVVFGDSMASIIDQSKGASRQLGLSSQQVINAANTYGTYGKAAGLAGNDLAKFSSDFTTLAGDMASFKGTTTEQAIDAIGAALRGETEPIRAYGVMLDDASMRQKALELGITDTVKNALTPQQKILAAQALIFEQTSDAQGDFQRTSQSTANIQRTLSAETENLSAKFGQVLAPAFTAGRKRALEVVGSLSGLLDTVIEFQEGTKFTPDLVKAVGLDPSQGFGLALNEGIGGIMAFSAAWKANDGDVTSSGFPGWMEATAFKIRTAVTDIKGAAGDLVGGDFSTVGPLFESIVAVARPAAPIFVELAEGLGGIAGEIGELLASGLPLLVPLLQGASDVMNYLADNTEVLAVVIGTLAAGYVAYKGAQAAANVAALLHIPVTIANATANWQLAAAIRAANTSTTFQASASKKTGAVMFGTAASTGAAAVTTGAYAGAATGASIATRIFGIALKALPFVGLAAAIAGLVAGVVWFFTETELGKEIVANAFGFIQGIVGNVVEWFQSTVQPGISGAVDGIGTTLDWLNTNVVQPVFSGIETAVGWAIGAFNDLVTFLTPAFSGIATVIGGFYLFFRGVFQVVVSIVKHILIPAFVNFWTGVIVPVFAGIGATISGWWNTAKAIFGIVVGFVRTTLAAGFTWFRDFVISPVFDWVSDKIDNSIRFWTAVFGIVGDYLHDTFGPAFTWFRDSIIGPVWTWISDKISGVWNDKIKPVFDFFGEAIDTILPKAFEVGKDAIEKTWNMIEGIAKAPVKFVVDIVLNQGLIKGFNVLAGILPDVDELPDIKLPAGFYDGGRTGGTNPREVRGIVHGQEVVVPHQATAKIDREHPGLLDSLVAGDTAALGAPLPGSLPFIWGGHQQMAAKAGAMGFYPFGGYPLATVANAVAAWQGRAGITPFAGSMASMPRDYGTPTIGVGHTAMPGNAIGYYSGGMIGMSRHPSQLGILIHEIGHAMGLHHNTGNYSIMHPQLGGSGAMWPTAYDTANLQQIYGAPGSGAKAMDAPDGDGGGGGWDWIGGLIDKLAGALDGLIDNFAEKFAGTGIMGDVVIGVGKKIWNTAVDWVKDLFGTNQTGAGIASGDVAGLSPMVFDGGGWLEQTGGAGLLVQHNKTKPDAVLSNEQWGDIRTLVADRGGDDGHPPVVAQFHGIDYDQAEEVADALWYSIKRRRRGGVKARRRELV